MKRLNLYAFLELPDQKIKFFKIKEVRSYTVAKAKENGQGQIELSEEYIGGYVGKYYYTYNKIGVPKEERYVGFMSKHIREIDNKLCVPVRSDSVGAIDMFQAHSDAPGDDYSGLLSTHAFARAWETLTGKSSIPIWLILVVLLVVVGGIVAWQIMKPDKEPDPGDPEGTGQNGIEAVRLDYAGY